VVAIAAIVLQNNAPVMLVIKMRATQTRMPRHIRRQFLGFRSCCSRHKQHGTEKNQKKFGHENSLKKRPMKRAYYASRFGKDN
jgi:hypothetical protein